VVPRHRVFFAGRVPCAPRKDLNLTHADSPAPFFPLFNREMREKTRKGPRLCRPYLQCIL
jgi:hypothetical protein